MLPAAGEGDEGLVVRLARVCRIYCRRLGAPSLLGVGTGMVAWVEVQWFSKCGPHDPVTGCVEYQLSDEGLRVGGDDQRVWPASTAIRPLHMIPTDFRTTNHDNSVAHGRRFWRNHYYLLPVFHGDDESEFR